jgi:hypothetical protein
MDAEPEVHDRGWRGEYRVLLFLVGWDWRVSWYTAATTGLLYHPRMIGDGDCEEIGGMKFGRETQVLGENLPQRHFVHHKSHMTRPGFEPAVGSQRLAAWAMARPLSYQN